MGLKICTSCKYSTNRWNGRRWYCKASAEKPWSWVLGRGVDMLATCFTVNNDGKCKNFERKKPWWKRIHLA